MAFGEILYFLSEEVQLLEFNAKLDILRYSHCTR
jgi:hypothetical protein